jgi:hypothetical protein
VHECNMGNVEGGASANLEQRADYGPLVPATRLRSLHELRRVWSLPKRGARRRKAGTQHNFNPCSPIWIAACAGMSGTGDQPALIQPKWTG